MLVDGEMPRGQRNIVFFACKKNAFIQPAFFIIKVGRFSFQPHWQHQKRQPPFLFFEVNSREKGRRCLFLVFPLQSIKKHNNNHEASQVPDEAEPRDRNDRAEERQRDTRNHNRGRCRHEHPSQSREDNPEKPRTSAVGDFEHPWE